MATLRRAIMSRRIATNASRRRILLGAQPACVIPSGPRKGRNSQRSHNLSSRNIVIWASAPLCGFDGCVFEDPLWRGQSSPSSDEPASMRIAGGPFFCSCCKAISAI
jgi:hypothetical protein